mgnify:CR=1 FL=1|jgi:DNA-binding transcriptional regulator YhcF (GntR family)
MPTRVEVNCETGVVSHIELTDEEIAQMEADAARFAEEQAAREAEAAAKEAAKDSAVAKFKKMGLSDEEIAAIVRG